MTELSKETQEAIENLNRENRRFERHDLPRMNRQCAFLLIMPIAIAILIIYAI